MKDVDKIDKIFNFIITAYDRTGENLSFLYFMKVVMLLTKKVDVGHVYNTSKYFKAKDGNGILEKFAVFFEKNHNMKTDPLTIEIVLY